MASDSANLLNQATVDEAARWFVEFRTKPASVDLCRQFNTWLRASPTHIRAYLEITQAYRELALVREAVKPELDGLMAAGEGAHCGENVELGDVLELNRSMIGAARRQPQVWQRQRLAIAASILLILGATLAGWSYFRGLRTTQIGELRSLVLADGTHVDLNARSRVRITMSSRERQVEILQGQAFFAVAKDPARPFVVKAGRHRVQALGTAFDINKVSSGTTVSVLEGSVAVHRSEEAAAASAIVLHAGQAITLNPMATRKSIATAADAVAWKHRRLIFDGTPLADVVEEFNRYNRRQLVLSTKSLANFHVSGVYSSTDPASLLLFLRSEPGIHITEGPNEIAITRR